MSQELISKEQQLPAFATKGGLPSSVNAGAVSIEIERAIAEAKGQMQLAKMFPRDLNAAHAELMEACKMPAFANIAFYTIPQGGSKVTGQSIRFAEEVARVYQNFEYGHRELSRVDAGPGPKDFGRSEVEIYAWDKQTNNRQIRQITVLHVLDTRDGPRKLRDQKDIDNKIANVASKQMRGRILAMMPKWLIESAVEECRKTLQGNNTEPLSVRVRKMTQAFASFGVTTEHLERYLGHNLDEVLIDELVNLTGVFNAIKEGTPPSEFFGAAEKEEAVEKTAASIAEAAKAGAAAAAAKPAEKKAAAKQESKQAEKASNPAKETAPEVTESTAQQDDAKTEPETPAAEGDDLF